MTPNNPKGPEATRSAEPVAELGVAAVVQRSHAVANSERRESRPLRWHSTKGPQIAVLFCVVPLSAVPWAGRNSGVMCWANAINPVFPHTRLLTQSDHDDRSFVVPL